jgi:conjugative transfer signal peptidase TraF
MGRPVNRAATFGLLGLAFTVNAFTVNTTPSVPVGVYLRSFGQPHRGDMVELCPPDAIAEEGLRKGYLPQPGPCHRFTRLLIKKLAAVGGDVVDVSPAGISINGVLWPNTQRRYKTLDGELITRWLPYGRMRLAPDRVLVLGTHPDSYDCRTWGAPVKVSSLGARMLPVFTWKGY